MYKTCLAGGVAAICAKTLTAPLDRVKILFQASSGSHPHLPLHLSSSSRALDPFRTVKWIHQSHGLLGVFQGHSVMLLR